MAMQSGAPPRPDEATFGRVERPPEESPGAVDYGPNQAGVDEMLAQARALSPTQARQLASAVAWHWVPLGIPSGSIAAARSAAIAAGRLAGRGDALEAAQAAAREAILASPGGREAAKRWSWAESALAALAIGVIGSLGSALAGLTAVAVVLGLVALVSGAALLFVESAYVRRLRLASAAAAAALGLGARDLVDPREFELLVGPWRSVLHD